MIEIRQTELFARWLANLRDARARMRINVRIRRLSIGNPGDVKPVGEGVSEMRIDFGPGTGFISFSVAPRSSSYWRAGISARKCVTLRQHVRLRESFRRLKWARQRPPLGMRPTI